MGKNKGRSSAKAEEHKGRLSLAADAPRMTILPDHAIPGDDPALDALELEQRLGPIIDIIRHPNTRPPMAVAIYGDWGSGKSSAMRWVQGTLTESNKHIKGKDRVLIRSVWFEPWKYHKREDVWRGLIAEVIIHCIQVENLDNANAARRLTSAARQFGQFLGRSFLHTLSNVALKVGVPGAEAEIRGEAFREIYKEWREASHPEQGFLNDFEQTLATWIKDSVPPETDRMVIFIDDLDRCLPEVALEVLEALKLYLSIKNLIFVVGVDRTVIESIVTRHYRRQGVVEQKSIRYLEKMFQVEATIEPSEQQIHGFFDAQVKAVNEATDGYWDKMLPVRDKKHRRVIHGVIRNFCYHNPRQIKRLLNNVVIEADAAAGQERCKREGQYKEERLAFAQGAQICLLRHVLDTLHGRTGGRVRLAAEQAFFKAFSDFVQKNTGASPADVPTERQEGDEESPRQRGRPATAATTGMDESSPYTIELDRLIHQFPALDPLWIRKILNDQDIWNLMRIPFSPEVASLAPGVGSRPSAAASTVRLPNAIAEIIAAQLRKPADALTSDDLGKIKELDMSGDLRVTDTVLAHLKGLTALQTLNLEGTGVTDTGVAHLKGLTALKWLDLEGTGVTDAGVAHLKDLTALQWLSLSLTGVTDAGVAHLKGLIALQSLFLSSMGMTDAGVAHLKGLTALQWLVLSGTGVTDAGLAHLKGLTELESLYLSGTGVTDAGLAHLKGLTGLQLLFLSGTGVTDAGLAHLKGLTALQRLYLNDTGVTDAGLAHLTGMTALKRLTLNGTGVTDAGLTHLKGLTALQTLVLGGTGVTDAGLVHLKGLPALQQLHLFGTRVSDAGVRQLKEARPRTAILR